MHSSQSLVFVLLTLCLLFIAFFFVRLYLHLVNTIPEQTKPSQSNQIFRKIFKHERIKIFVILLVWIINIGMDIFVKMRTKNLRISKTVKIR